MARSIRTSDRFKEKLLKLIPSEIVAAYVALQGLLVGQSAIVDWVVIGILTIMTFVYMGTVEGVKDLKHKVFSTISFLVWVYAVSSQEVLRDLYNPQLGSIILILWTLLIPLVMRQSSPPTAQAAGA